MNEREKEVPFFLMEESSEQPCVPKKMKRKARPKKMEFVEWGSKPLIEFLESIGKDTSKNLSQKEVADVINKYARGNNLFHPEKKKRIVCDEKLHSIFRRKTVARNKIFDLLDAHFSENHDDSEDELLYSSEEKEENVVMANKRQKPSSSDGRPPHQKDKVLETPKSCFAAIISENIKLVYLKRTLVQDLLKDPESFEGKVVGSYVRIKSDPYDYLQKNSHQLLQVTGLRKASGNGDIGTEILLQASYWIKDIQIGTLSEADFSEEECIDLQQRVKAGLVKRPTVVELEQKAQILHEDITKHWLVRELVQLQHLIDRANEKGWRKELDEYLDRRTLLESPSEQSRLLLEVPKVIADELELKAKTEDCLENAKQENQILSNQNSGSADGAGIQAAVETLKQDKKMEIQAASETLKQDKKMGVQATSVTLKHDTKMGIQVSFENLMKQDKKMEDQPTDFLQQQKHSIVVIRNESNGEMQLVNSGKNKGSHGMADKQITRTQVIELSDDDQEDEDLGGQNQMTDNHLESLQWHYLDPQGVIQGPFSIAALKRWSDADYFDLGFTVWKAGQSQHEAVLLSNLLRRFFPN